MEDDRQCNCRPAFSQADLGAPEPSPFFEVDESILESFAQLALHDPIPSDIHQPEAALLLPDSEWENIQRQLVLYLHADRCIKRQVLCSGPYDCSLPHCSRMKTILHHINTCLIENGCTETLCRSTKKIIRHWEFCRRESCPVCRPIRISDGINDHYGKITFNSPPDEVPADNGSTSTSISAAAATATGPAAAYKTEFNMFPAIPSLNSNLLIQQGCFVNRDYGHLVAQGFALEPFLAIKEWHQLLPVNFRQDQIRFMIKRILPFCNQHALSDVILYNLMTYAGFLEIDAYKTANSRDDYVRLLNQYTHNMIEQLVEEKRKFTMETVKRQ